MTTALKLALPKGRLLEPSLALLRSMGATVSEPATTRKLLVPSSDGTLSVLFVKPADVPVYVESGAADVGITGTDVLRETAADVLEPLALGFGRCRMVVASPAQIAYPALPGGVTPRVATKYPRLTRAFFAETGLGVEVIAVSGSVEVAPLLGLSHWIVDLVDTGRTLRENGLVERAPLLDVGAVVVVNRASQKLRLEEHQRLLERLQVVVRSDVTPGLPALPPRQLHR
ncbi:MAG TPA: ATP phosphoribosyltransferase [Gemmatimonadales bacterium]|nr:ATP phosphoribosyltransferase [Gemmatimonadales bacterium]